MTFGTLRDISQFAPQVLIVGSGPSALGACLTLIHSDINVLLVTGGSSTIKVQNQELAQGSENDPKAHEPLEDNRVRASGGTSQRWGGRCVPLDRIDFENREWLPVPAWPISFEDVEANYFLASEILGTKFTAPLPEVLMGELSDIADRLYARNRETWTREQNIFAMHRKELSSSTKVLVLEDVHVTGLTADEASGAITNATLSLPDQENYSLDIRKIILTAGAIENARLLLLLKRRQPALFPKSSKFIGANYMTHPIHSLPYFELRPSLDMEFLKIDGENVRRRINLKFAVQKELGIGNSATFLARESPDLSSFLGAGKELTNALSKYGKDLPMKIWNYRRQIIKTIKSSSSGSTAKRAPESTLHVISEHLPNALSRISLGNRADRFGNPLPNAKLHFSELDRQTLLVSSKNLARSLSKSDSDFEGIDWLGWESKVEEIFEYPSSHAHMLGGTAMSVSPQTGVTDAWGQVHEIPGLYCTGTSLFVTSGQANPTLTAVSLAIRTAKRIIEMH